MHSLLSFFLQALINLLYFCGMNGFVKDRLLQRYFSSEVRDSADAAAEGTDLLTMILQVSYLAGLDA